MWLVYLLIYILLLFIWITVDITLMEYDYLEVLGIEIGYISNGAYIPLIYYSYITLLLTKLKR